MSTRPRITEPLPSKPPSKPGPIASVITRARAARATVAASPIVKIGGKVGRVSGRSARKVARGFARLRLVPILVVLVAVFVLASLAIYSDFSATRALDQRMKAVVSSFEKGPAKRISRPQDLASETRQWLGAQGTQAGQVVAVRAANGEIVASPGGIELLRRVEGGIELLNYRPDPKSAGGASSGTTWWELPGAATSLRAVSVSLMLNGRQIGTLVVGATRLQKA